MLTRRDWIRLGLGVPAGLAAIPSWGFASKEFWDAKPYSEWSSSEVERMLTKSPWAKEVAISSPYNNRRSTVGGGYPQGGGGYPQGGGYPGGGGGYPGGGGIGFPGGGIGFPGGGRSRYPQGGGYPGGPNGGNYPPGGARTYHATLRWESSAAIQDALRLGADDKPNPDFEKYYVLNLIGDLPDDDERQRGYNNDDPSNPYPDDRNSRSSGSSRNDDDDGEERRKRRRQQMFKEFTKLERKDGFLRLEKVEEGSRFGSSGPGTAFYFSRRDNITIEDRVMSFYTKIGTSEIRAKFTLKEMMYQGKLAL